VTPFHLTPADIPDLGTNQGAWRAVTPAASLLDWGSGGLAVPVDLAVVSPIAQQRVCHMSQSAPRSLAPPSAAPAEVIPLPTTYRTRAVEVLTLAFLDDPLYRMLIPETEQRRLSLQALWSALIKTSSRYGVVDTTPDIAGIACWLAPGNADLGLWPMVRTGLALPRAMMQFPADSRKKFLEMVSTTDRIRLQHMPHPHWYLWALAVDPARQGAGIGGTLLAATLRRADAGELPCYLETETESNVAFYTRRGFKVVHEEVFAELRLWSMLRAPRPSAQSPSGVP
jgi:ribosomal protein S18 acetylase RimI-like enzyme